MTGSRDDDIDDIDEATSSLTKPAAHRRVKDFVVASLTIDPTISLRDVEALLPDDSTKFAWSGVKKLLQDGTVQYAEEGTTNTFERGPNY